MAASTVRLFLLSFALQICCYKTEDSNLAYLSTCKINHLEYPCTAAQWTEGGGPYMLEVVGKSKSLSQKESCGLIPFQHTSTQPQTINDDDENKLGIVITPRGGCSFATKAITVQKLGFTSLIIIDNPPPVTTIPTTPEQNIKQDTAPQPPGLGIESADIHILVVMMSYDAWNIPLFDSIDTDQIKKHAIPVTPPPSSSSSAPPALSSTTTSSVTIELLFSRPKEAELWLSSPWYENHLNQSSLSLTLSGERYTLRCDIESSQLISDDTWLLTQWLQDMQAEKQEERNQNCPKEPDNESSGTSSSGTCSGSGGGGDSSSGSGNNGKSKGCLEIRNIEPRFIINQPLSHENISQARHLFNQFQDEGIDSGISNSQTPPPSSDYQGIRQEDEVGVVLFRLPHWDSAHEPMDDIAVIDGLQADREQESDDVSSSGSGDNVHNLGHGQKDKFIGKKDMNSNQNIEFVNRTKSSSSDNSFKLLRGLNSNSHKFPWNGGNKYPRLFEAGVLVMKNACVKRDGVIVRHQSNTLSTTTNKKDHPSNDRDRSSSGGGGNKRGSSDRGSSGNESGNEKDDGIAEYHYGGCGCCPSGHGELGKTFSIDEEETSSYDKVIVLVQRFHHVYYHFILEMMGRLLQVLPLLQDEGGGEEYKVLVDTSNAFVYEVLIDIIGLKPSQILSYQKGVSVCSHLLVVPAPIPCGHMSKNITVALKNLYTNKLLKTNSEFKSVFKHHQQINQFNHDDDDKDHLVNGHDCNNEHEDIDDNDNDDDDDESKVQSNIDLHSVKRNGDTEIVTASSCVPDPIRRSLLLEGKSLMLVLKRLGTRSVLNHDELFSAISDTFTPLHYQVVEFEASMFSVSCQAVWLQMTSIFIAPHGSGLSNAIFLPTLVTSPSTTPTSTAPSSSLSSSSSSSSSSSVSPPLHVSNTTSDATSTVSPLHHHQPIVIELLPWEYPNLTFYVSLIWLPLKHIIFTVKGNAYGAMEVDAVKLIHFIRKQITS